MPEKTKLKKDIEKADAAAKAEKTRGEIAADDKSLWSGDQREKSYYYDDAHGYEIYNAEDDDDDESGED